MTSPVGAVIVAAGSGERLGADVPKALVHLDGRPLVRWATEAVAQAGVAAIVVVGPPGHLDDVRDALAGLDVTVVEGGATRTASVRAGVAALRPRPDLVAIHDAARARMPASVIRATIAAVGADVLAAAPGLPIMDTLKRVGPEQVVRGTVDRAGLWAVQTPQVFTMDVLEAVHAWAGERATTDDLGLFEHAVAAGAVRGRAVLVQGHPDGAKITVPDDLAVAEALVRARQVSLHDREPER